MPTITQTLNFTSLVSSSAESLGEKINDALQSITDGGRDQIEIQDVDVFIRQKTARSSGVYNVNIMYRTPGSSNYFAHGVSIQGDVDTPLVNGLLPKAAWLTSAGMLGDGETAFPVHIKQINARSERHTLTHDLLVIWKKQDAWTDTSDGSRRLMIVIAQAAIAPNAVGPCVHVIDNTVSASVKQIRNVSNIALVNGGAAWAYMDVENTELVCIPSCCN